MFKFIKLLSASLVVLMAALIISHTVFAQELKIKAKADPPFGEVPTTVKFTVEVTGGEAVSFLWEFGDGESCETQNCEHTYEYEGLYRVKLTVKDASGNEFIELITVRIEEECRC